MEPPVVPGNSPGLAGIISVGGRLERSSGGLHDYQNVYMRARECFHERWDHHSLGQVSPIALAETDTDLRPPLEFVATLTQAGGPRAEVAAWSHQGMPAAGWLSSRPSSGATGWMKANTNALPTVRIALDRPPDSAWSHRLPS